MGDYERGFRDAQQLAAKIADERCKSDYAQWKDDVNWQQPFACNRVVRASMSIAAEIRALAPPDARAAGASDQESKDGI